MDGPLASTHFDRFNALIKTGSAGKLSKGALVMYLSYLMRADNKTALAWPGNDTICLEGAMDDRNVPRSRAELVSAGLLRLSEPAKKGSPAKYEVMIAINRVTPASPDTGVPRHRRPPTNLNHSGDISCTNEVTFPAIPPVPPYKEEPTNEPTNEHQGTNGNDNSEIIRTQVRQFLREHSILVWNPRMERDFVPLVKAYGLAMVARLADESAARGVIGAGISSYVEKMAGSEIAPQYAAKPKRGEITDADLGEIMKGWPK